MTASRVGAGGSSLLNPFSPEWQRARDDVKDAGPIGKQVQSTLFGRTPPPILDPSLLWRYQRQLRLLKKYRRKIVTLFDDDDDEYPIILSDGEMVMIDSEGQVYMGAEFLEEESEKPEVIVGALSHEIGHRPKRWGEIQVSGALTPDDMNAICRHEEAKADAFAGMALAELQLSPEPLIGYLNQVQVRPHPSYFPVEVRADIIREACKSRTFRAEIRKKLFPDVDRLTSAKHHLGDF